MSYPALDIRTKQAYYNEWLLSGEAQPQFLRRKKLGPSTFKADGLKRGKPVLIQPPISTLLPVQIKVAEASLEPVRLWVEFSNRARLHFVTGTPVDYMGSLIASVQSRPTC